MKEQQYHIDVTPEEDALFREEVQAAEINSNKPKFSKVFWLVLGAHVAVIGGLITTCSAMGSKPAINLEQPVAEIPDPLPPELESPPVIAAAEPNVSEPVITPEPTSTPKVAEHKQQAKSSSLIKNYTVKQGDTIYSISRKYKLNTQRLIEINNIKNPNSIKVGQTLKFM